ncbi:interaptin-like [Drosophila tropicalis]|uniref:interaptin-like n=1 Tax=Drosophila tropicalis TaxID=46794 RepID=UPI0035ABC2A3
MRLLFNVLFIGVLCALQLSGVSEAKPWLKELLELKKALITQALKYIPESRTQSLRRQIYEYQLLCIDEVHEFASQKLPDMPRGEKGPGVKPEKSQGTSAGPEKTHDTSTGPEKTPDVKIVNFNIILQTLQDVFKKEENMAQKNLIEQIMILVQNLMKKKSEQDSPSLPSSSVLMAIKELLIKISSNQNEESKTIVPNYAEILKILLGEKRITNISDLELTIKKETVVKETHKSNIEDALGIIVGKVLPPSPSGSFNFTIELEEPTIVHQLIELSDRRTNDVQKESPDQQANDVQKESPDKQADDVEKQSIEVESNDEEKQSTDLQDDDVEKESTDLQDDDVEKESSDNQLDKVEKQSLDKQADEVEKQSSDKQADEVEKQSSDKQADEVEKQSSDKEADEVEKQSSDKQANNAVKPRSPFIFGLGFGAAASATVVAQASWGSGKRKMRSPRNYPVYYPVRVPVPVPVPVGVAPYPYPPYPYSPYYPPLVHPLYRTERQKRIIRFELNRLIRLCVQRKVLQARATNTLLALSTQEKS